MTHLPARGRAPLRLCLLFLFALVCAASLPAMAAPELPLARLHHTSWNESNGVPEYVDRIAQTRDGYIWLGSGNGLYRFDGVNFTAAVQRRGTLPSGSPYNMVAGPDGGLWMGWSTTGVTHYRDGIVTNYGLADGLPGGTTWDFAFDQDGGVWAAGLNGVSRFDGKRWTTMTAEHGITAEHASAVFVDAAGTVAVFSEQGLFLKPKGAARFNAPVGKFSPILPPQQRGDGPIYFFNGKGVRRIASLERYEQPDHPLLYNRKPAVTSEIFLADSAGYLWFTTAAGLHRVDARKPGALAPGQELAPGTETYTTADGLTSNQVEQILEDSEGNIWVSTGKGLERFSRSNALTVRSKLETKAGHMLPDTDGAMLFGDDETGLTLLRAQADGTVERVLPDFATRALMRDRHGALWRGSAKGIARVDPVTGKMTGIGYPAEAGQRMLHELMDDSEGGVWASIISAGVYRHHDGAWTRITDLPRDGKNPALSMLAGADGTQWFGYTDQRVAMRSNGKTTVFGQEQGLLVKKVNMLAEDGGQVWIGGSGGFMRYHGGKLHSVTPERADVFEGASGMVSTRDGHWINALAGLVFLSRAEADKALRDSAYRVRVRVFDKYDDVFGTPVFVMRRTIALASDGKVWFNNSFGTHVIDPERIADDPLPRAVTLDAVEADGRAQPLDAALTLAPNVGRVALAFSTPATNMGERLRFRYRLDGYDKDWQSAGAQRSAVYTGLPPGRYQLHVQAINGQGVAGPDSTLVALTVPPTFVQTAWFKAACALAVAVLLWLAYRWRLRQQEARLLASAAVRQTERERIARELHDTLLQGIQGLILRFQSIADQVAPGDPLRLNMETALDRADEVMAEGRDRVQDLRLPEELSAGLAAAIRKTGALLSAEYGLPVELAVHGDVVPLRAGVDYDCYRIASEAMLNACHHAQASRIDAELAFSPDELRLTIRDDGSGIDAGVLAKGQRAGHWGLSGMRERADMLGAAFDVRRLPDGGTEIALRLPAARAYGNG